MTSDPSETPASPASPAASSSATAGQRPKIKIGSQRDTFPAPMPPLVPPRPAPPPAAPPAPVLKSAQLPMPAADGPEKMPLGNLPVQAPATSVAEAPSEAPSAPVPAPVAKAAGVSVDVSPAETADLPPVEAPILATPKRSGPVPVPRFDDMETDLQKEIDAALGEMSLDQMMGQEDAKRAPADFEAESRHRASVVRVHRDNVFFSLGSRNEGVASLKHFASPPEPGTMLDVVVARFNAEEGLYELIVPGATIDVTDWADIAEGTVVEARITGANTGGLECAVNALRGFIPASQISLYRVENLGEFVGQKMACVVTEANPERRNLVLSRRAVLEREKEANRAEFLANLEVGQTREGVVRSIRDFGAFVDLGGVDGLIHVSKLSWDHVKHPSEVLQEGQKVSVKVDKIDVETGKIGLSYRDLQDHPWTNVTQKYPLGTVVPGVVSRLANFGAFVKLGPGIEGLIHISELSHQHVRNVGQILKEGQAVEVKILSVDAEAQRIALSLKALLPPPETAQTNAKPEVEEPPPESVVPKRLGPLKGGLGKASGEQFGLRW